MDLEYMKTIKVGYMKVNFYRENQVERVFLFIKMEIYSKEISLKEKSTDTEYIIFFQEMYMSENLETIFLMGLANTLFLKKEDFSKEFSKIIK